MSSSQKLFELVGAKPDEHHTDQLGKIRKFLAENPTSFLKVWDLLNEWLDEYHKGNLELPVGSSFPPLILMNCLSMEKLREGKTGSIPETDPICCLIREMLGALNENENPKRHEQGTPEMPDRKSSKLNQVVHRLGVGFPPAPRKRRKPSREGSDQGSDQGGASKVSRQGDGSD